MLRFTLPLLVATVVGCTYKEYNTYNQVERDEDAGVPAPVGPGGNGGGGNPGGGAALGGSGDGADAGGNGGSGGGSGEVTSACAGCSTLAVRANQLADVRLAFGTDQNLAQTVMTWRVRVVDFAGDVNFSVYAQSGNAPENELVAVNVNLNLDAGWQEIGVDMAPLPPFSEPALVEGVGGGGFDPGFGFDKSDVENVGLRSAPIAQSGVLTSASIEIDGVSFSNRSELDVNLNANDGGLELVGSNDAVLQHIPN